VGQWLVRATMHDSVKGSDSLGQPCMIQSREVARYRAAMHNSVKGSGSLEQSCMIQSRAVARLVSYA
jgi:hypothetical protein